MLHDGLGDGEAETCTLNVLIHLDKGVENGLAPLFVHATTRVGHEEIVFSRLQLPAPYPDGTFLRKLQGVAHQVGEHLREAHLVNAQTAIGKLLSHLGLYPLERGMSILADADFVHQGVDIHLLLTIFQRARLDAREVQQVADQLEHVGLVLLNLLLALRTGLRIQVGVVGQHRSEPHDAIERRTYLVGHVGDERLLEEGNLFVLGLHLGQGLAVTTTLLTQTAHQQMEHHDEKQRQHNERDINGVCTKCIQEQHDIYIYSIWSVQN